MCILSHLVQALLAPVAQAKTVAMNKDVSIWRYLGRAQPSRRIFIFVTNVSQTRDLIFDLSTLFNLKNVRESENNNADSEV